MNQLQTAKIILKNYGSQPAVLFTSDGSPFVNEGLAKLHAKQLANKQITTITRQDIADAEEAPAAK